MRYLEMEEALQDRLPEYDWMAYQKSVAGDSVVVVELRLHGSAKLLWHGEHGPMRARGFTMMEIVDAIEYDPCDLFGDRLLRGEQLR